MNAFTGSMFLFLLAASSCDGTPMDKVVVLIKDLKAKVLKEGKEEQLSYDKYSCWCENTLATKVKDISEAKDLISDTEVEMKKVGAEIASHGAEITQLEKGIAKNIASQKETQAMRDKDFGEYHEEKSESEQCIGALEAATKVMTGAGAKKAGFLDTSSHEAQLISVAASLRSALRDRAMPPSFPDKDIAMVKRFVDSPEAFVSRHSLSAAQLDQNPFGDYAPQSSQIQGILKGLYDSMTADLEKANSAEAESTKSFEALMSTKQSEHSTLAASLKNHEAVLVERKEKLAEANVLRDDTADQLEADEEIFANSKEACQTKAQEWSERTRLRMEELAGMGQAITILSDPDARATFKNSTTTFLQVGAVNQATSKQQQIADGKRSTYNKLKSLATQFQSLKLAKIALTVQQGGHLNNVVSMIDDMIVLLRKEEADDIAHRDKCETAQTLNTDTIRDLQGKTGRGERKIGELKRVFADNRKNLKWLKDDLRRTQRQIPDLLAQRNEEVREHRQALKDDADAIALLQQAIGALGKFYDGNKIPLDFAQGSAKGHDGAPGTSWSGGGYGGKKSESSGIIDILAMLVEDFQNDMEKARSNDVEAQAKFEYKKQSNAVIKEVEVYKRRIADLEDEMITGQETLAYAITRQGEDDKDLFSEGRTLGQLKGDCAWVASHFKVRREQRKVEIDGLVDAKAFVAQVATGEDPLPPMAVVQKAGKVNYHSEQLPA